MTQNPDHKPKTRVPHGRILTAALGYLLVLLALTGPGHEYGHCAIYWTLEDHTVPCTATFNAPASWPDAFAHQFGAQGAIAESSLHTPYDHLILYPLQLAYMVAGLFVAHRWVTYPYTRRPAGMGVFKEVRA